MLRNTFKLVATTSNIIKSQNIHGDTTINRMICKIPLIKNLAQIQHQRNLSTNAPNLQKDELEVFFVKSDGTKIRATGKSGDSLLDVVVNNSIDLEGFGACEGTLTCSTCHLILKQEDFDRLPEKPGDEELDMLDLAYDLTDTSRLGCQIILTKELNGLEVRVPTTINDARS